MLSLSIRYRPTDPRRIHKALALRAPQIEGKDTELFRSQLRHPCIYGLQAGIAIWPRLALVEGHTARSGPVTNANHRKFRHFSRRPVGKVKIVVKPLGGHLQHPCGTMACSGI